MDELTAPLLISQAYVSADAHKEVCRKCTDALKLLQQHGTRSKHNRNVLQQLNNPGAVGFAKQLGALPSKNGLAVWITPEEGWVHGIVAEVAEAQQRGCTLRDFVVDSLNGDEALMKRFCVWLNARPNTPLGAFDAFIVAVCIARSLGYFEITNGGCSAL